MPEITVYGASDDCIEVEGAISEEFSPHDDVEENLLAFSDGTVLRIEYTNAGIWRITPVAEGTAELVIIQAPEDDDRNYTDRATMTGDVSWVVHGIAKAVCRG